MNVRWAEKGWKAEQTRDAARVEDVHARELDSLFDGVLQADDACDIFSVWLFAAIHGDKDDVFDGDFRC